LYLVNYFFISRLKLIADHGELVKRIDIPHAQSPLPCRPEVAAGGTLLSLFEVNVNRARVRVKSWVDEIPGKEVTKAA
jgi:hypothetical protein